MNSITKVIVPALPLIGLIAFAGLYILKSTELSVLEHYQEDTFIMNERERLIERRERLIEIRERRIEEYFTERPKYKSDLIAFNALDWILPELHDGKYRPWLSTEFGLVKFNSDGNVESICLLPARLKNMNCPPNL